MGLDIFVGSFTRYYAGNWETITQKFGREQGMEVQIVRPNEPSDPITNPSEILPTILSWRDQLSQGLGAHIESTLNWNETDTAPYFTDKPTWDCYSSMLLWAAYTEHPKLVCPLDCVKDLTADAAFQLSSDPNFKSAFSQLLRDVEIWLPHNFSFTFRASDPIGQEVCIGSSVALCDQLDELNCRTWKANETTLGEWRFNGADYKAPLEVGARFAFSIMTELARKAVEHQLIMKLDY